MKNFNMIKLKMADLRPLLIDNFFLLTRFTQHFFMFGSKIDIIYPSLARMSSKLGKIRTETRSWRPKWPIIAHYFFNMRNICQTGFIPFIRFTKIRRPSITPLN